MRVRRVAMMAGAVVGVLLVAGAVAVYAVTNTNWGREQVRVRTLAALAGTVHGRLQVARVSGNLLESITLHDVRIVDSAGAPFVSASRIETGYALRGLLSKRIDLSDLVLDSATIVLDRAANGTWNYERIFPSDTTVPADSGAGFGDWIRLRDLQLINSRLMVRMPWIPDSTLSVAVRDSVTDATVRGESRITVVRHPDGSYQQVQDFRNIYARLPLIRLADPELPTRLIRVDSLRMQALAFAPPAAEVRQLAGEFELDADSLWFRDLAVRLPASRAQLTGRYEFSRGDLRLQAVASPVALTDVRFLYPALPSQGESTFALDLTWENGEQRYVVRQLDLATGETRVRGDLGVTLADTFRLHDTALSFQNVTTALMRQLVPGLELPREGSLSGTAIVSGSMDAMQIDGDVTFDDSRSGRSRVLAAGELGAANGVFRASGLRVSLAPLQVDMIRSAAPSLPLRGIISGRAVLDGESDALLRARDIDVTHLNGRERSRVTGRAAVRLGRDPAGTDRWLDVRLSAQPLSLITLGRFAPAAGMQGQLSGPMEAVGPWSALAVDAQLRGSDGGSLAARGTLDLASRDIGYALDVRTVLLNMNELSTKAPQSSLTAFVQTRARGFDPETMRGTFAATLEGSALDTVLVDSLSTRVQIASGMARIDSSWVRGAGVLVDLVGTFGLGKEARGTLDWRANVDSLSLLRRYLPPSDTTIIPPRPLSTAARLQAARRDSAELQNRLAVERAVGVTPPAVPVRVDSVPALRRDSIAGRLTASGRLTGGLNGFDLTGVLEASGLVALGNSVQQARATFAWNDALTEASRYRIRFGADSLLAAGFALDSVSATVDHTASGGTAAVGVYQNDDRDYGVRARYALFPDRREVYFDDLRLRFDTTLWRSAHPGALRWGQPGIFIDSLDLRSANDGRVFANGLVPNEGAADLRLLVNNFQMGDLLGLLQSDIEGRGRIMVDTRVSGTGRSPRIEGRAQLLDAQYRGTSVPNIDARYSYADRSLTTRAVLDDSARGSERPVAALDARLPVDLAFSGVTGSRVLDFPARADLVADSLPLDLIAQLTESVTGVRGTANGSGSLRGTLREPILAGTMVLRDGRAHVTDLGVTMERINGSLRLDGDTLRLDSLVAWSKGRIALDGRVGVADFAKPSVDLRLIVQRAQLLNNDQGQVRADAEITARGPFDDVLVAGSARVRDGVLYIPTSNNREVISAGDPSVFAVIDTTDLSTRELLPMPSPLLANLQMDLGLEVDRDTWVRSKDANVEIYSDGPLRIQVDRRRQALTLDGVVNTDRGEYELLGKRFQIKRGAVQFIGTRELNPLLQITAEYEVNQASRAAMNVRVLIGGTLNSPRLTLESDAQPPISQTDLLSYLAFGNSSGSLLQFGGSSLSGGSSGGNLVGTSAALATRQLTSVALGVAVDELEGQAARSLGADVFNITPANVPPELASGNFGALSTFLRGTQFEFGKYVNTRTFVGLQFQVTTAPGFRLERQLGRTPGLSLEGTLQPRFFLPAPSLSQQEITKANAFGLFLRRRWRF